MKVKTGIAGVDEILKGGLNEGSAVLVTGAPGTGKSIFAVQFIYQGCIENEPSLYITCEESVAMIKQYAKGISLDFDKFEKKGVVVFLKEDISLKKPISLAEQIKIINEKKIKRVVLDSLTYFEYAMPTNVEFRKSLLEFLNVMKEANVTLLVISEESSSNIDDIKFKPQDFLFDGLILLSKIRKGSSFERCVNVVKMRGQNHLLNIYPFTIEQGGILVYPKQTPFSLK